MNAPIKDENLLPASPGTIIFDHQGHRTAGSVSLDLVLEPETFLSNDKALTLGQTIRGIAAESVDRCAIGIKFGKFTDGRSYSVAARLREAGYAGELHALGDINQEVVFLLRRVGFTHFHIPDPGTDVLSANILTPFGGHYQAGTDGSLAPWQQTIT